MFFLSTRGDGENTQSTTQNPKINTVKNAIVQVCINQMCSCSEKTIILDMLKYKNLILLKHFIWDVKMIIPLSK